MPFRLATLKLFGQSLSGNKKIAPKHNASKQFWCRWRESNPHGGLAQRILSPPRLPVPTHRHKNVESYETLILYMIEKKKSSVFTLFLEFFLIFFLFPLRFFLFRGKIISTTLRNSFYGKISIYRRKQSAQ